MTPEQLAKSGSEHGEQRALIAWANQATAHGVWFADQAEAYSNHEWREYYIPQCVGEPRLEWLHAIHNQRDGNNAIAGAKAKAEGVKAGVADLFLPFSMFGYHGLYIEMKKVNGSDKDLKPEQREFRDYALDQSYQFKVAFGWKQARAVLLEYLDIR